MNTKNWVTLSLATYAHTSQVASVLVDFLEAGDRFVAEHSTLPRQMTLAMYYRYDKPHKLFSFYDSPKKLTRLKQSLLDGEVKLACLQLVFEETAYEDSHLAPPAFSTVTFGRHIQVEVNPLVVILAMRRHQLSDRDVERWQHDFVELGWEYFTRLGCATGHMTCDTNESTGGLGLSNYEARQGLGYERPLAYYRTHTRGYFWGNWLNPEHIRALGGVDRVIRDAPCERVDVRHTDQGDCAFLQLTPSIDDYSDDSLDRLRQFLCPIVPMCNELPRHKPDTVRQRIIYSDRYPNQPGSTSSNKSD